MWTHGVTNTYCFSVNTMAERVHQRLEDTAAELQALVKHGWLSHNESALIASQRTDFEFRIARRKSNKTDYLMYIAVGWLWFAAKWVR